MRRHLYVAVLTICFGMFTMPSSALAADPGITDSEVVFGVWTSLTGPTSEVGTSTRDGLTIWANQLNGAGGVHRRKVRLVVYDDAASPQEALAAARRLIGQDKVFALLSGSTSGPTLPVVPVVTRAKVPFIASVSSNMKLMEPYSPYIFRVYANDIAQTHALVDFAMTKARLKRPAALHTSNDYGVGGINAAVPRLREKYNSEFVGIERFNDADTDFSAQLLRLRQVNPDGIIVWAFSAQAGIIVRQARELGLTARLIGGGATSTPLFPRAAGPAGVVFTSLFVLPHLPESSMDPTVVAYREELRKIYPGGFPAGRPGTYDMSSFAAGKIAEEALRRAGRDLSRERFIEALETLKDFDPGTAFPVTFSRGDHEGSSRVRMIRINAKFEWEPVAD